MTIKRIIRIATSALMLSASLTLEAAPVQGVHYEKKTSETDNLVVEFFSYSCHHCYKFESMLSAWEDDNGISVKKIPIDFKRKDGDHFARIYYTLRRLGIESDREVFSLIHEKRHRKLSLETLADHLEMTDTQRLNMTQIYHSAEVEADLAIGRQLIEHYHITGVPALVVKGEYITDAAMSRGLNGLLSVADYFLENQ